MASAARRAFISASAERLAARGQRSFDLLLDAG